MTKNLGRALPSSGQTNLLTKVKICTYMWDEARGVQRDLVVTGFYLCNIIRIIIHKYYTFNLEYGIKHRETLGIGCLFCVGRYGWLTGCSCVGAGVVSEGVFSVSAGRLAIVCVWRVWLCERSGQISCCSFGVETRSRCDWQSPGLRRCVLGESRVRLSVNDTTVIWVVGM